MAPSGVRLSPAGIVAIVVIFMVILYQVTSRMSAEPEKVSLRALLIGGIGVAERGGDQVRQIRLSSDLSEQSKGKTKEGANDPLTKGDLLSHQAMSRSFRSDFSNVHLISEEKDTKAFSMDLKPLETENEGVSKELGSDKDLLVDVEDVTVWIDPLDATQEYTENLTEYVTTMLCVAVKGKPVIGIIHKPFTRQTFWGWVDYGSNVEEKHVGNEGEIRIIVSRSHAGEVKGTAQKAFGKGVTVVPAGGAGFKSLALFDGKASVYLHTTRIKKWDICAGDAILRANGGKMTTLNGADIDYSRHGNVKNDAGLVAALHKHEMYLSKLGYD